MGKLVLTLLVAAFVATAFYLGWFNVSSDSRNGKSSVEFSVDSDKVKVDAKKAGEKIDDLSRDLRKTHEERTDANRLYTLEFSTIEVPAGGTKTLTVTRRGDVLPPLQLLLAASPGSNLRVTGGEFKDGDKSTTVTIEAALDAKSGTVTLGTDKDKETITVTVKGPTA